MGENALTGTTALITGGGTGIGLGCASALVADGANVVLAARNADRLDAAADGLRETHPDALIATVACDVTDEASVEAACAFTAEQDGNFSIVVANAGYGSASPFHLQSLEEWNGILGTNLTGAFLTMKHVVPHFVASGGGSIVAMSSIAGVSTHRFMAPYTVSKAGLEMLVKHVADELGPSGIRANAVRPGLVPTEATEAMMTMDVMVDDYVSQMPLGRTGTKEDIASLVRFLAGPESSWITGACISADGGHHLRRGPNFDPVMEMMHGEDMTP